ncbi:MULTISPECIES: SWIM zinc finger family protein [unclassified Leptolyngbya]|uniref:SWIM zinc finger family protein n=1 Tax=unclassified Leptolyngbya TaxID=2650499 RepID=UPI001681E186|nr:MULTISPECIES: SWIM zinc finger family protein [unclassified Leptolyngbya]MBD1909045.1 SWIM zinc finger family protein [Leptolyngbya sp. FACHB-8]MBD2157426.1 SWIM zinc finger family protein [Leptolyngbya sp. FACHB-16]
MPAQWTVDQVLALAPDAASAKNGRGLATRQKWVSLGCQESVVWGECRGSGKNPYQTQIDLSEPAFRCSCPSRKFPCKHGLGLFLLLAEQPEELIETDPPSWVADWIASRSQRTEKKAEKQSKRQEQAADPVAQAKRVAERQRKVSAGIQELRLWLEDRVRQGLATLPQEPYGMWDGIAARMVDAQAPGLARQLRELAGIVHSGANWHDRVLERLGRLYLIIEGFERIETLPTAVQSDLRTQIGWSLGQDEVLAGLAHSDLWLVVGQRTEEEERLRSRRTWLYGITSQMPALSLDFAHGQQPFEQSLMPGTGLEAELVFYPSAYPVRALMKTRQEAVMLSKAPPGRESIGEAIAHYSKALATCPWLERFPLLLADVTPRWEAQSWLLQDRQGAVLPLSPRMEPNKGWQLLALSGGQPLTLFGEWNGASLSVFSVWAEDAYYGFGN